MIASAFFPVKRQSTVCDVTFCVRRITRILQNPRVTGAMSLSRMLSTSSLETCFRYSMVLASKRSFGTDHLRRTLPPTVLSEVFTGLKTKKFASADFGKDATAGNDLQRAVSFVPPCLKEELLCKFSESVRDCCHKVTIVGAGMVGIAVATTLLMKNVTSQIAIVDAFPKKMEGEGMDLSHGAAYLGDPRIDYDTDFCISSNSKVIVITAGVRQVKGETRLDTVGRNSEVLKSIIPTLVSYSPNAVIVVVTNPVDILSWITWKVSGLPVHRIIGCGTIVDSARFRYLIGDRLGIAPSSVHGYIIGEHGNSQVPLWSGVNVAGVQFRDILPNIGLETDEERWYEISKEVVRLGLTVRCLKGYTNIAVGLVATEIVAAILGNTQKVLPVSTLVQGHYDICHEMFLSVPCAIGENGITNIVRMRITEFEKKLLLASANIVYDVQKDIKVD